jgi:hypothetical protein
MTKLDHIDNNNTKSTTTITNNKASQQKRNKMMIHYLLNIYFTLQLLILQDNQSCHIFIFITSIYNTYSNNTKHNDGESDTIV